MMPSLAKSLSKTLVSRRSVLSDKGSGSTKRQNDTDDQSVTTLRRRSTKQLESEDEENPPAAKVRGRSSITKVRSSSIVGEVARTKSKTTTSSLTMSMTASRPPSQRASRPPARLVEEDEEAPSSELRTSSSKYLKKNQNLSLKRPSSRSPSLSKSPSKGKTPSPSKPASKTSVSRSGSTTILSRFGSKTSLGSSGSKTSMSKAGSKTSLSRAGSKSNMSRSGSKTSMSKTGSKGSMSRSGSKISMVKKGSVKAAAASAVKQKKNTTGKELWFDSGAYLTVRNEEGGFYLCRAVNNIYNTTKMAKVRWLGPKTGKPKKASSGKRKRSLAADTGTTAGGDDTAFELMYPDTVDPTSVLMEVEVGRKGTTYLLSEADKEETVRLLQVAEDVQSGKLDKGDIGEDVDEAVLIDYEPPAKRRKMQAGTASGGKSKATNKKKPRLKKTASQKEREKSKKAQEREEKKGAKKIAAEEQRKAAVKFDDTTLKPNPAVKVLAKDPLWDTTTHMPYVSKVSNAKLIFRAVKLGDNKMLKKLLKDADRIYMVDRYRCEMVQETPLEVAVKQGNKEAIDLLIEDRCGSKFAERLRKGHDDKRQVHKLGTGQYNYRSLGKGSIRPLMASRGAREGNNALIKDNYSSRGCGDTDLLETMLLEGSEDLAIKAMNNMKDPPAGKAPSFSSYHMRTFIELLPSMLARGQNHVAGKLMKVVQGTRQYYRIPSPLWKVLDAKDVSEVPSVPPSTMDLKMKVHKGLTMIHAAASNPNADILAKVLNTDPNFLVSDNKGLRPVHIAAGCSSPAPLQMLLDRGSSPYDADSNGDIALHYAVRAGRTKNVEILLKILSDSNSRFVDPTAGSAKGGVNYANKKSLTALHMACLSGNLEVVKLLVKHGANTDVKTSINQLSVTPLMMAAGGNHLDIVRCLVDAGAVAELRDRVGRTALMHAAMNGATRVMSYLLHLGADPNRKDTSGNTPLHYAAAYGWYFSVKLLLDSGADPAVSNDWATTPLSVAYLKGHQGVVSVLLEDDRVDINFPDENGETLLLIACSCDADADLAEEIRYLIKEKGADCNIVNLKNESPLHCLANTSVHKEGFYDKEDGRYYTKPELDEEVSKAVMDIAKMLVDEGCEVTHCSNAGRTAAMQALIMGNIKLAQFLVERGSPVLSKHVVDKEDAPPSSLLHCVAEECMNRFHGDPNDVITFLSKTITVKGEKKSFSKELVEMAQTYDYIGDTPLLKACSVFSDYQFDGYKYMAQRATWLWGVAFSFLQNLVKVAKSDVNAANKPKWQPFGAGKQDENDIASYYNRHKAGWTPLFHMVHARMFTTDHKHISESSGRVLKFLLSQGAKVDTYSLQGHTPLTYAIECKMRPQILILVKDGNADVNRCMRQKGAERVNGAWVDKTFNVPPIYLMAIEGFHELLDDFLDKGADVNAVHEQHKTNVLHALALHRHNITGRMLTFMEKVLKAGVNVNAVDKDVMTPLHILVKHNPGRIDDSFEEEILLITHKTALGLRDNSGRMPLHYVFFKGNRWDKSSLDPVDLCKLLVKSMAPADLNKTDKCGRTPLHYAAQRNASVCCMYLMQKGANCNVKDKEGNTPLALAVMNKHDSCSSVLIQNGAELKSPVVKTVGSSEDVVDDRPPEWKWKPMTMAKKEEKTKEEVPLFQEAINHGLVGTSFLILEWPVEKSGITLVDAVEMAVKNSQFNVALRLLSTVIKGSAEFKAMCQHNRNMLHVLALHAATGKNDQQQVKVAQMLVDKGVSAGAKDTHGCTPLLYAALNSNFTLAQFFADQPGLLNAKYTDGFNRNLVAASLWNCFFSGLDARLREWVRKLHERKVDLNATFDYPLLVDVFGSRELQSSQLANPDYWCLYPGHQTTPLIFALLCKHFEFTQNLLLWGANPNLGDKRGRTPLMHAVKLNSVKHVKQLLKYDYHPEVDDADPVNPKKQKKKVVKKNAFRLKKRVSSISDDELLSSSSSSSSSSDEEDKVKKSSRKREFKTIAKTSAVNVNAVDQRGWTALHYAACPLDMGTFDNDELVFVLGKAGAKLDARNTAGETPLNLALTNNAPRVAAMLQTLMGMDKRLQKKPIIRRADHRVNDGVKQRGNYDFHSDAQKQLGGEGEEMEEEELFQPQVSEHCNIAQATIVQDEDQDVPYEVLMTKCDASLGEWGLYNFYQMQLLHQSAKNLYILFTRWGRIGATGQFQHTPFNDRAAGIKEFCKIFRAKSGNKWEDVKSFEQKERKYRLVPAKERKPPVPQKKVEFDFGTNLSCTLPEHVHSAMKIMVDIERLQDVYQRDVNMDTDVLPFGRFSRDRLLQAKQLLDDMSPMVFNITQFRKDWKNKTAEEKQEHQRDCQKVSELSSDYYQLIPQKNFVYEKLRPLDRIRDFKAQYSLITNLLDFETSTKMMLGAMYRKTEVHPLDYIYSVLHCKLELMEEGDPMTQNILRFAQLGDTSKRFEGVYKVEREGEEGRFQSCGLNNRRLLWHGTRSCNLVSILNRGLVAQPLDAQLTGQLFGKGIYFSELMVKSSGYSDSSKERSSFMLLCEVALGKVKYLSHNYDDDDDDDAEKNKSKDDEEFNSGVMPGRNFPDPDYDVQLPSGETISLGDSQSSYGQLETACGRYERSSYYTEYIAYSESQVCIRYLLQYRDK